MVVGRRLWLRPSGLGRLGLASLVPLPRQKAWWLLPTSAGQLAIAPVQLGGVRP